MKKRYLLLILLLVLLGVLIELMATQTISNQTGDKTMATTSPITPPISSTTVQVQKSTDAREMQLINAYPDFLKTDPENSNGIVWKNDGTSMQYDDGISGKDFETLLSTPDLEDQMAMPYVAGEQFTITKNDDPGRVRVEAFFKKMYGSTEAEVKANLVTIHWLPSSSNQPLQVTRVNGISQKLQAISNELDKLVQQPGKSYLLPYLKNPAGTFKWRDIAETDRLSSHSFGIAIDINSTHSDYWQWATSSTANYHNQVPFEIVKIFEKYGFIWGGKWYHYDTMHFEYRPELLVNK